MRNSPTYTRRRVLTIAIVTAASSAGVLSLNAGVPADRRIVAQSRFDVTSAPLQAEVVQLVVDFPPGAWTSWHTHGGQAINLVLEGEITLRHGRLGPTARAKFTPRAIPGRARLASSPIFCCLRARRKPRRWWIPHSNRRSCTRRDLLCRLCLPKRTSCRRWSTSLPAGARSGLPSASRQTSSWPVRSRAGSAASASSTRRARLGRRPLAPSLARRTAR